jgi:hypothetical protein
MNWEEIRELHKEGIEIGSHTMTHNFLPKLNAEIIEKEILKSQVVIKKQLDQTPQSLALPFSFPIKCRSWPTFESLLIKCLEKGNYTSCCTMVRGHVKLRDNLFFLKRIPVLKNDDILSFNAKLVGAYAWSRYTQYFYQLFLKKYERL